MILTLGSLHKDLFPIGSKGLSYSSFTFFIDEKGWREIPLTQLFAQNPPRNFYQIFTALDTCWSEEQRKKRQIAVSNNNSLDIPS